MTWGNWIATQGEAFKRGHLGAGTLDAVKGAYEAGVKDGGGGGGGGGGGSHAEKLRAWKNDTSVSGGSDIPAHNGRGGGPSSGGGSGPKVLKKGDAGHGGGKKRRRY